MTNSLSNYAYGLALLWVVLGCSGCQHGESPSGEPAAKEKGADSSSPDGVAIQLNDAKRQLLRFESRPVSVEPWTSLRTIPAKLALDPDRHFAITSPVNVVVEELLAEVGSPVEAGTPPLKLSAPEITQLRGKLKSCKSKLEQMEKALAFQQESQECITKMKEDIQQDLPAATIAKKYQFSQYGKHGEAILEAYTRWQSSQQLVDGSETAIHAGALPKRVTIEREAERVTRRAGLDAALQQAKFDLQQNTLAAQRAVIEARSELGSILAELDLMQGIPASQEASTRIDRYREIHDLETETYIFRSPRKGTVFERHYARGERAEAGQILLLVADLSRLWVVGELRSQDWDLLRLPPNAKLKVEVVGFEKLGWLSGELNHLGGAVDPQSGAIPFAANLENPEGVLRPGMHSRIRIERKDSSPCHLLPATSLFTHDGMDYLVEDVGDGKCVLRKVNVGRRNDEWIELLDSFGPERKFVTRGAFSIASEALLEPED